MEVLIDEPLRQGSNDFVLARSDRDISDDGQHVRKCPSDAGVAFAARCDGIGVPLISFWALGGGAEAMLKKKREETEEEEER